MGKRIVEVKNKFYLIFGKRCIDLGLAITGLLLIAPVLIIIGLLVRLYLGSPIIFHQLRPGKRGKPFFVFKFRTMSDERDENGNLLHDTLRSTKLGRFLRATSLDELPELWNVIKGNMSIVGPRPLKMDYLPLYTPEQARRHELCPGITGWAQINGRNALDWDKRFQLDVWYIDNCSLCLDMKIILQTFLKVCKKEGASPDGGSSVLPPFQGSDTKFL